MTPEQAEKVKKYCKRHPLKAKDIRIDDMSWRGGDFYDVAVFRKDFYKGKKRGTFSMYIDLAKTKIESAIKGFNESFEISRGMAFKKC